jgi:hypothetical protein
MITGVIELAHDLEPSEYKAPLRQNFTRIQSANFIEKKWSNGKERPNPSILLYTSSYLLLFKSLPLSEASDLFLDPIATGDRATV